MILKERLGVDMEVADGEARLQEELMRTVETAVIRYADQRAYLVRPGSVHVAIVSRDPARMTTRWRGTWSPRSARFISGEYDGDTLTVTREADGLPAPVIVLPYRAETEYQRTDTRPSVSATNPRYEREGIDVIHDVWVYRLAR